MKNINGVEVLDTIDEILRPGHTALLVIDVQNDFCHPEGHFARYGKSLGSVQAMLPALVDFVAAAQCLGIFTAFICQQTLPHGRSDSPAWLRFKCRDGKSPEYTLKGSWGAELVDGLVPTAKDVTVEKFRPDAFLRTALDAILRSQGIESLVIVGTTTEGCVESTVRAASYHDYYVVPVTDLIAGPNAALHQNSLQFMSARYPAATSEEVLGAWRRGAVPTSR
jgi:nicotinamidase-related amidase